jgi:hypothetical protein
MSNLANAPAVRLPQVRFAAPSRGAPPSNLGTFTATGAIGGLASQMTVVPSQAQSPQPQSRGSDTGRCSSSVLVCDPSEKQNTKTFIRLQSTWWMQAVFRYSCNSDLRITPAVVHEGRHDVIGTAALACGQCPAMSRRGTFGRVWSIRKELSFPPSYSHSCQLARSFLPSFLSTSIGRLGRPVPAPVLLLLFLLLV